MENKKEIIKRNIYNKTDSGLAFLLCNVIPLTLTFVFLFVLVIAKVDLKSVESELWYLIISALISQGSFILTTVFINKTNKVSYSALKVKFNVDLKTILLCVVIAFVCFFGLFNLIEVVGFALDKIGYVSSSLSLPLTNGWNLVLNLLLLGVLPAIAEELVFRGIIFNGLKNTKGNTFAVVISALLFALMHGNLAQLVYPFIMGLVFAIIVLRTGNLLCSIIVHMTNNFLVIIFSYIQVQTGFSLALTMNWWGILIAIAIAIVACVILYLLDRFVFKRKQKKEIEETKEAGGTNLFMYIGIAVALLMFLINTISSF